MWFNFGKNKIAVTIPKEEQIARWMAEITHTPDAAVISRRDNHLLFVPDEMMRHNREHSRLDDAEYRMNGFTNDRFSFLRYANGGNPYPIALERQYNTIPFSIIKGEVYAVPPNLLIDIDNYRRNGVEFQRERRIINVLIAPKRHPWARHVQQVRTWMYTAIPTVWEDTIDCGFSFTTCPVLQDNTRGRENNFMKYHYYYKQELNE